MQLLNVLHGLDIPNGEWLPDASTTVWNALTDRPRGTIINDYDVLYFDGDDLSRESELAVERSVRSGAPTAPLLPRCAIKREFTSGSRTFVVCPTRHYLLRMNRLRDIHLSRTPSACALPMTTA
jgi:hypothetical protein